MGKTKKRTIITLETQKLTVERHRLTVETKLLSATENDPQSGDPEGPPGQPKKTRTLAREVLQGQCFTAPAPGNLSLLKAEMEDQTGDADGLIHKLSRKIRVLMKCFFILRI